MGSGGEAAPTPLLGGRKGQFGPKKARPWLLGPSQMRKERGFYGLTQGICKSCSASQDELLAGGGEE